MRDHREFLSEWKLELTFKNPIRPHQTEDKTLDLPVIKKCVQVKRRANCMCDDVEDVHDELAIGHVHEEERLNPADAHETAVGKCPGRNYGGCHTSPAAACPNHRATVWLPFEGNRSHPVPIDANCPKGCEHVGRNHF